MADVTQGDEARAIEIFDDALGDMSSFGEFGRPSYRDGALRTISMHLAAHREAAVRDMRERAAKEAEDFWGVDTAADRIRALPLRSK